MKIDLTCPVELWQYAMPTEDDAECTFVMNNLSDKVVTSVQVALNCYDEEDELLFHQTERVQGLKAGVGERFTLVILPSEWQGVEGVDLVIEKVWFDDATVWRKGNAPLAHYTPNAIAPGRALDDLRFVAGKDAAGYPQVQEEVWVCVCGRANALDSDRCCRCERRRDTVFASFSRENVNYVIAAHESKLAQTARKAREENNIVQENHEKQRAAKRRKRRQRIRLIAALAIIAVIAAAVVVWGIPMLQYSVAQDLLRDGHFDQARAAFAELEDWKDSQTQVLECDYRKAASQLDSGEQEALESAEAAFAALADYRDSASQALQAAYELGQTHLEAGRFEAAAEKFQALGDYLDSAELLQETAYRQADAMAQGGSYLAARVLFENLAAYKDAPERVKECTYQLGKSLYDEGSYEKAIAELETLEDEASLALVSQAYYQMAENAMREENYSNAGKWYQLAGDYADAPAKANDCLYQYAHTVKAQGDYAMAQELFESISGYLDSEGQAQTCVYARAETLMQSKAYEDAIALFETIADYGDAQVRMDECRYELAMAALESGDSAKAEEMLGGIVDYEDAQKQLRTLRYKLAESDLEAGDYASAMARYEALDGYRDSKTKVKQCRYQLAEAALETGEYEKAVEAFMELGGYKQSKARLEEAQYQLAQQMLEKGETQKASELLSTMNSDRARARLNELSLAEGEKLEQEGKLEEAAALYESLKGSPEASSRAKACRYQLAVQVKETGDLPAAARAFEALDSYEDAKAQAEDCWAAYYGDAPETARAAMETQDYLTAVTALENLERNEELNELYLEACYLQGDRLYADDQPYQALPFYQRAVGYRDTAEKKLDRRAYLILGEWKSTTGKEAVFRTDGTCEILGEKLVFRVSNFSLYTGEKPEEMTLTHKLSTIDQKGMSLRDIRDGQDKVYKFSRVGEFDLDQTVLPLPQEKPAAEPEPEPTPAPTAEPVEEMLVTEETDESTL